MLADTDANKDNTQTHTYQNLPEHPVIIAGGKCPQSNNRRSKCHWSNYRRSIYRNNRRRYCRQSNNRRSNYRGVIVALLGAIIAGAAAACPHSHAHAYTHTHTHTRTRARTHTHTHTQT